MRSKYIELLAGVALLFVAVVEIVKSLGETGVALEHGVAVFALSHVVRALTEIREGLLSIRRAVPHRPALGDPAPTLATARDR